MPISAWTCYSGKPRYQPLRCCSKRIRAAHRVVGAWKRKPKGKLNVPHLRIYRSTGRIQSEALVRPMVVCRGALRRQAPDPVGCACLPGRWQGASTARAETEGTSTIVQQAIRTRQNSQVQRTRIDSRRPRTHFDFVRDPVEKGIRPAIVTPHGQERAPDTRIQRDEAFVSHPQPIPGQHLAERAHVIAGVLPLHNPHVLEVHRHQRRCVGLALENEDEVGARMERPCEEELEVVARVVGLGICI